MHLAIYMKQPNFYHLEELKTKKMSLVEYFYVSLSIYATLGIIVWLVFLILLILVFILIKNLAKKTERTIDKAEEMIYETKRRFFFVTVLSNAIRRILGRDIRKIFSEAEGDYKRKE